MVLQVCVLKFCVVDSVLIFARKNLRTLLVDSFGQHISSKFSNCSLVKQLPAQLILVQSHQLSKGLYPAVSFMVITLH